MFHRMMSGIFALAITTAALGQTSTMVPFVIPATPNVDSLVAYPPSSSIAADAPRVVVTGSHFTLNGKPIKFLGVNLTFGACFPTHADAEQLALRLSQAGVNCVRLHHMDMSSWDKQGIWDTEDPKKLSRTALERLDYLMDQLAKHGVYADLNLHVSRTHSKYLGLPPVENVGFDKMTDLFMPQLIDAQQDYGRQLLGHVNQYRKVRYADDPMIAIVEISNEDSLFEWGARAALERLPEPYASVLRDKFCEWLSERYGSTDALRKKWSEGAIPLGDEILVDRDFEQLKTKWMLEVHENNTATQRVTEEHAVRLEIAKADGTSWHVQFHQPGLRVKTGEFYTLSFMARADKSRGIQLGAAQAHDPWNNLGLDSSPRIGTDWATIHVGFAATASDDNGRISFQLGHDAGWVELKEISLRPGGREGLKADESIEKKNIAVFDRSPTPQRELDTPIFLAQTEKHFWDGMHAYLRTDLHCSAMITGTIVFGPLGLYGQSDMDFIDAHEYWQHPTFPGKSWDMGNWLVNQSAMVDHPAEANLANLACSRLAGKPFTVTEYCHPAPNDYQAECVPELASYAAAQDWDAIFLFDYGEVPNEDHFHSFFDTGANPAKWAFMPAAAAIFRGGAVGPLGLISATGSSDKPDALAGLVKLQMKNSLNMQHAAGVDWRALLQSRIYFALGPATLAQNTKAGRTAMIHWNVANSRGTYVVDADGAWVWVGRRGDDDSVKISQPIFAAITAVATDGQPLGMSKRILITSCGRCENTGMKFAADRRTVGKNFGTGPVCIEPVEATMHIPVAPGQWIVQSLDGSGRPTGSVKQTITADSGIHFSAADATAWHLLTRN